MREGDNAWASVNVNMLLDAKRFNEPDSVDYEAEATGDRVARRKAMWTPAHLS